MTSSPNIQIYVTQYSSLRLLESKTEIITLKISLCVAVLSCQKNSTSILLYHIYYIF
jgi:hypothetical protein